MEVNRNGSDHLAVKNEVYFRKGNWGLEQSPDTGDGGKT
jgi:hypothetical protein